jgi:hypothetical protein
MNVRGCGLVVKQVLIEKMIVGNEFDICTLSETNLNETVNL